MIDNYIFTIDYLYNMHKNVIKHCIILFLSVLPSIQVYSQAAEKLSTMINTERYDEVAPVLSPDGQTLYFSRLGYPKMVKTLIHDGIDLSATLSEEAYKKKIGEIYSQLAGHTVSYPLHSVYNQDIWVAQLKEGQVTSVELPSYPLNSALPSTVLSYWKNKDELILLNQFFPDGSMNEGLSRIKVNERNKLPKPLHVYNFYTRSSDVQASISQAGDILILALNREDSHGDMDLYVSYRTGQDIWSEPQNMGGVLNSPHRESTPYLSSDTKWLFFASDRTGGMGGMDIYVSERKGDWQSWTVPKLLEVPVNSISDDSQPHFSPDQKYLYFTSTREGSSDIFRYPIKIQKEEKSNSTSNTLVVEVVVIEKNSGQPIDADINYRFSTNIDETYHTKTKNGSSKFVLTPEEEITFHIEKEGYEKARFLFDPSSYIYKEQREATVELPLEKIETKRVFAKEHPEKENFNNTSLSDQYRIPDYKMQMLSKDEKMLESYILDDILFQPQTAMIKASSYPSLNRLVTTLKNKPGSRIIIEGHTDNGLIDNIETADPELRKKELLILSEKRANAVKGYLIEHEIDPSRIKTVGHGDKYPLNDNSNKMERSLNRRVEIVVIE